MVHSFIVGILHSCVLLMCNAYSTVNICSINSAEQSQVNNIKR